MFNVALIGCGYWGSKLKGYIEENEEFNLKYICNSKSDLNEVWNDEGICAVVIAVRNEQRYCIARDALLHKKHVLCEKPLALRGVEANDLKQLAIDYNLALFVDYTWTFSKGLRKATEMIFQGMIGDVLGIEMNIKHLGRFYGGSVYWLLGSHGLSILDMFVPLRTLEFTKKDLVVHDGNVETGVINFTGGQTSGQILLSLNYPGKTAEVIIYGSKGTIIYSPLKQPSLDIETYERIEWTLGSELPKTRTSYCIDEGNNLRYAIEYFAEVLKGNSVGNLERAVVITEMLEGLQ